MIRIGLICLFLILFLIPGVAASPPASAAPARGAAAPQAVSVETGDLESLIQSIEDEGRRKALLRDLKTLLAATKGQANGEKGTAPETPGAWLLHTLSDAAAATGNFLTEAVGAVADPSRLIAWVQSELGNAETRLRFLEGLLKLGLILGSGILAEWLMLAALRAPARRLERQTPGSAVGRTMVGVGRALIDLASILAFAVAGYAALTVTDPARSTRLVALVLINGSLLARALTVAGKVLLAPRASGLRVLPLSDETAAYLYVWLQRLVNITVYGYFGIEAAQLLGLPRTGHAFLVHALGGIVAILSVILVLQNRAQVGAWIRGADTSRLAAVRRRAGDLWHILAIAYLVALYFVWALGIPGGFDRLSRGTVISIVAFWLAYVLQPFARRLLVRAFTIGEDLRREYPSLEQRANRYLTILGLAAGILIYGAAAVLTLGAWGIDWVRWLTTPLGLRFAGAALSIVLATGTALLIWDASNALIERHLSHLSTGNASDERRNARLRTLLPLLQRIMLGVLAAFVGLIALSEVGIDIMPLLAGAGVLGISIGLGAQSLMKDLISGISNVLEDSLAVGDVVSLAGKAGVVEEISIRSLRLRDAEGVVHMIPFSEVNTVSNLTKDFSFAVIDIGVAYSADLDRVMEVMRQTASEMRRSAPWDVNILEDLEVLGVEAFQDSAIMIRARIKTLPGKQWPTLRDYRRRIKSAFDRAGIEIPFPQRTVHFTSPLPAPGGAGAK